MKVVGYDNDMLRKVTCPKCTAIIEYSLKEVTSKKECVQGDTETVHGFNRPECGHWLYTKVC